MADPGPTFNHPVDPQAQKRGLGPVLAVVAILFAVLLVIGIVPRLERRQEVKRAHEETVGAVPVVHTITARPASKTEQIILPGNIGAIQYTSIYARIDGYLTSRMVDIGDTVKQGQLLAQIDTPTTDQQLEQSRADLKQAQANLANANAQLKEAIAKKASADAEVVKEQADVAYATVTASRWRNMCAKGAVSEQSRDEKVRLLESTSAQLKANQENAEAAAAGVVAAQAEVKAMKAAVAANSANVRRLVAQTNFKYVTAPFDGVITLRKVDPGALITQGSQTSSLELFQMAKIDRLRIYVNVPQRVSRYLRNGLQADILVSEFPDRKFVGTVTNVSGALDPNTRTRQTEIQIDNKDHALLPGMYAEVNFSGLREAPWIRVPGTTIVVRPDGQYVVVVKDEKAHYQKVTIGRDFGMELEIRQGLRGGEAVVVSPSDDLTEGERVNPIPITASAS